MYTHKSMRCLSWAGLHSVLHCELTMSRATEMGALFSARVPRLCISAPASQLRSGAASQLAQHTGAEPRHSSCKQAPHLPSLLTQQGVLAGHGSQTKDWSGDERDGMNETLCPCDFKQVSLSCCLAQRHLRSLESSTCLHACAIAVPTAAAAWPASVQAENMRHACISAMACNQLLCASVPYARTLLLTAAMTRQHAASMGTRLPTSTHRTLAWQSSLMMGSHQARTSQRSIPSPTPANTQWTTS